MSHELGHDQIKGDPDMRKLLSTGLVAAAAAALLVGPAVPAAAGGGYDCTIMGPAYVEDAVDCAYYILEHLA